MKLHVAEWGDGDKFALLVHGLFSDARSWHRLGPALAGLGYHVLAPELRGHGQSPRGRYSPYDWAMDLLDTVRVRPQVAVGHSLGGLALNMVAEVLRPATAVYLDPAWRMSTEQSRSFGELWSTWLTWTDMQQLRTHLGARWPETDVCLRWASMWRADPAVVAGLAAGCGYDLSPERASMPSLVLSADPSDFIPPEHAEELRRRGLRVETVAGTGHSVFREDFPRFFKRLETWLSEHGLTNKVG